MNKTLFRLSPEKVVVKQGVSNVEHQEEKRYK